MVVLTLLFFLTHKSLFTIFLEDNCIFPIIFFFGQGELVQKQIRSSERERDTECLKYGSW